jgi:hypothetical protein
MTKMTKKAMMMMMMMIDLMMKTYLEVGSVRVELGLFFDLVIPGTK